MQEQTQPTEQLVSQTADILVSTPKSNRSLIISFIVISILLVASSVFAGIQIGKNQPAERTVISEPSQDETTPALATNPSATPIVTESGNGWMRYTHQQFPDRADWKLPWNGFTIYYPATWKLTENKDATAPSLNLIITKTNGDYVEIIQATGGGGYCLFPDQPEYATFDGMATQYTKYIEINKGNGVIWRLADWPTAGDMWSHQLCESFSSDMFENGFASTTIVGFTKIKVSSPESLKELTEILKKLEISN